MKLFAAGIESAAVELIGKTDLSQQSIIVLGTGEMVEACVRGQPDPCVASCLTHER